MICGNDKNLINIKGCFVDVSDTKIINVLLDMGYKIDDPKILSIKIMHDLYICRECYKEYRLYIHENIRFRPYHEYEGEIYYEEENGYERAWA